MSQISSEQLRAYLLGILTEGQDALEERLMKDDEAFELLRAEEEELIQEYADGELSDMEREKFESHFLISDERLKKVQFATALKTRIEQELSQLKKPECRPTKD